jgi:hypothetical protein
VLSDCLLHALRGYLYGNDLGCSSLKLKSQDPFTRNIPVLNSGGVEFPASRGGYGQTGKIFAWAGRIESRFHHSAGRIHSHSHGNPNRASNSVSRTLGHVGQDLLQCFTPNQTASARFRRR